LHEVVAIKTAANTRDIEAHEDRFASLKAKVDTLIELVGTVAAGVEALLRRSP
jgi:hypothetical protein